MMTKMEAYRYCQNHGAAFVANVVLTRHQNPAKKLCAMARLLKAGSIVTLAAFDIDTLLVDGRQVSWQELEQLPKNS